MGSENRLSVWLYTDADNTLWDTNAVFAEAQLQLLRKAEVVAGRVAPTTSRLEYLRRYDQAIARSHHARLRYPPALLFKALILGLQGLPDKVAAAQVVSSGALLSEHEAEAVQEFQQEILGTPPLLPKVMAGLKRIHALGVPIYIITEGPVDVARERVRGLGIEHFTNGVLSATKTRELYLRLAEKASPLHPIMIGDQADRDIRLPHSADFTTVLVRSDFRPEWISDDDSALADAIVPDFESAIQRAIGRFEPQEETFG